MAATATRRKRRTYAPRVPAEQRRAQLLDAALHLVVSRGHNAVTMAAVADHAGVTKPVVYGIYANRAELLAALLRRESEQALAQVLDVLPEGREGGRPAELLSDVLDRFLCVVRAAPERWHCVVMSMPDMPAEFHAVREQARGVALARAEQLVREQSGAPSELDPEILAHTLVSLFEMAARLVLTEPERFHPARFAATLRSALGSAMSH